MVVGTQQQRVESLWSNLKMGCIVIMFVYGVVIMHACGLVCFDSIVWS